MSIKTLRSFQPWLVSLAIFVFALGVRLAAVAALRDIHSPPGRQAGADGVEFNQLALNLAAGKGYELISGRPTSFRAPGFPLALSAVYRLTGERYIAAYLFFCVSGAASCVLSFLICRELELPGAAVWAAALSAAYFPQVYSSTVFLSENFFGVIIALCVWLQLLYLRKPSAVLALATGVTLGVSVLTRPFALLLAPCLACVTLLASACPPKRRWIHAGVLTMATAAILAPWTWRNYQVHHALVLVATNGGSTFYGGNNDIVLTEPSHLGAWVSTGRLPGRDLIDATPDEVSHDKMEWRLGIAWVRGHVWSMPRLLFYKFVRFWLPDFDSGNKKYVLLQVIGGTPFLLAAYAGLALTLRNRRYWTLPWLTLHTTILASVATALIFWGSPRFRDANAALLMVYASAASTWAVERLLPSWTAPL